MKRKLKTTSTSHPYSTRSKRTKIASEILDLPSDVMILIFKLLTPSERRSAITVCHQWLDLVNQYFSKDHCLVLTWDLDYSTTGSLFQTFSDHLTTTKEKRTFSHMEIQSFPRKLSLMGNFIELIGAEVTSLKIGEIHYLNEYYQLNLFSKLPKLETLEISSDMFLADLVSTTTLKSIRVLSPSCDVKHVENYRKLKGLESLTMTGIGLRDREMSDDSLLSFLEPKTKELLEQMVPHGTNHGITLEASTFNFCGATRLSPDAINGLHIEHCDEPLPHEILNQFNNLKRLKLNHNEYSHPLVLTTIRVEYSGITELELYGFLNDPPHLDTFLQSFPNLEKLKIQSIAAVLQDHHFTIICEFMPKLKELVLDCYQMEISIRTVLDGQYALKDLRFLEKFEIHTEYVNNSGQWPSLPNLKELRLNGDGFSNFNRDFYSQIALKCPKLTHVTIDCKYVQPSTFAKFLPLLQQLKLTHLSLPCVDNIIHFDEAYAELVANLIEHCQDLREVTILNGNGFSLPQEIKLFSNIASLEIVSFLPWSDEDDYDNRVMKRKDVKNLKGYLFKNLARYKNIRETIYYVINRVIPRNEFLEMKQSFHSNFVDEDEDRDGYISKFYIVVHEYLGMSYVDLCKFSITLADSVV